MKIDGEVVDEVQMRKFLPCFCCVVHALISYQFTCLFSCYDRQRSATNGSVVFKLRDASASSFEQPRPTSTDTKSPLYLGLKGHVVVYQRTWCPRHGGCRIFWTTWRKFRLRTTGGNAARREPTQLSRAPETKGWAMGLSSPMLA